MWVLMGFVPPGLLRRGEIFEKERIKTNEENSPFYDIRVARLRVDELRAGFWLWRETLQFSR